MGFFSSIFGSITNKKKEEKESDNFVRIFIEENSYKSLKKEKDLNCQQICQKFQHVFPRKNKKSEFRIVLTIRDKKKQHIIVSKRILNNFEKIFDGYYTQNLKHLIKHYAMVDV